MSWGHWKRWEFKWPPVQTVPKFCSVHVLEYVVQVELCIIQKWVYMWSAVHLCTSPVEIWTPSHWSLSGCNMTTLPPVLSPNVVIKIFFTSFKLHNLKLCKLGCVFTVHVNGEYLANFGILNPLLLCVDWSTGAKGLMKDKSDYGAGIA